MKHTKEERTIEIRKENQGVQGEMKVDRLIRPHPSSRLFADVSLAPGSSITYHKHSKESETYYILEGEGIYQDNENRYPVAPGDATVCPSGGGHSLQNTGDKPLRFIALILKEFP